MINKINESVKYLKEIIPVIPDTFIILGSGLGVLGDYMEERITVDYRDIPHFATSTAHGHAGKLIIGYLNGVMIIAMQGRFHAYEGYSMEEIVYPIRVLKFLGLKNMIITNAAGGINTTYRPGDFMLITDHLKFTGLSPLIGQLDPTLGKRFIDMTEAYNEEYLCLAEEVALNLGIDIKKGVYAYMVGPAFETPAEIDMLRTLKADAVGMSTVPEVLAAHQLGLHILGISCITNEAASKIKKVTGEEVMETADRIKDVFVDYMKLLVTKRVRSNQYGYD